MGKKITAALTVMMLIFAIGCGADDIGIQAKSIDDINIADYTDAPEIPPKAETITCRADNYRMTVSLDTDENVLSGDITMTVNNMTDDVIDRLCVRNYAASIIADVENLSSSISDVYSGSIPIAANVGADPSVVYFDLESTPLQQGETRDFSFSFNTDIPKQNDRFGYHREGEKAIYQLAFCFPVLSMYEDGVWNESPYFDGGESNFNTVSSYEVEFSAPEEYTVVGAGNEEKNGNVTVISGDNLREMAVVVSNYFRAATETASGVAVNMYSLDYDQSEEYSDVSLRCAVDSVNLYSKLFDSFPYDELDVVQTFQSSAMEYPGIVMIGLPDVENYKNLDGDANYVGTCQHITHEVAHQWFYGLVGNDPYREPWLDEAFAEFCEQHVYQTSRLESLVEAIKADSKKGGSSIYGVQSDEEYRDWMDTLVEQREKSEIDRPVNEYDVESQEYSRVVYSDGALFLYELNQSMGDSAFYSMLQSYCRAYKFRESSTEEFLGIVKQYSDTDETRDIVNRYFSD